jgi:hypothetical protein
LSRRLYTLASNPSVTRLAKAFMVYGEYPNLLHTSAITNDIRPVFDGAPEKGVTGAMIVHTLKLDYHSAKGREELYVALDDNDLEDLGEAVERAKRASRAVARFIESAGLVDLTGSSE